jgi:hypothetical protein
MKYSSVFSLGFVPFAVSNSVNDVNLAFRKEMTRQFSTSDFALAMEHDAEYSQAHAAASDEVSDVVIACTTYSNGPHLQKLLAKMVDEKSYHPVYSSAKKDRACYSLVVEDAETMSTLKAHKVAVSAIPSAIKFDESVERHADSIRKGDTKHFVLEISLGLGVQNKGLTQLDNRLVGADIISTAEKIMHDKELLAQHWSSFYWTGSRAAKSSSHSAERKSRLMASARSECSFKDLVVEHSTSHVSITKRAVSGQVGADCMLFLASVASLRRDVTAVSAHQGESFHSTKATPWEEDPYGPTDQNAWVQSGNSVDTPYSDIGVDGSNYVLGIVDSGADDLSCFLIDSTGEQTTRTPGQDYANPITENSRRKVIQYVAWGDGSPSYDYDHGEDLIGACLI